MALYFLSEATRDALKATERITEKVSLFTGKPSNTSQAASTNKVGRRNGNARGQPGSASTPDEQNDDQGNRPKDQHQRRCGGGEPWSFLIRFREKKKRFFSWFFSCFIKMARAALSLPPDKPKICLSVFN